MSDRPSLYGVEVKLARARHHAHALRDESAEFLKHDLYRFRLDIYDEGRKHVWRTDCDPPDLPDFAAVFGDFIHNLRSALDHLAWQLVRLNGNDPHELTQFPIRPTELRYIDCVAQETVSVRGGVSDAALAEIKAVQPYAAPGGTRYSRLWWLHRLDVIDKHRHLHVFAAGAYGLCGGWFFPETMIAPQAPLKRDQVVMVLTYAESRPMHQDMKPMLAVFLGKAGVIPATERHHLNGLMEDLYAAVELVIDRFRPTFGGQELGGGYEEIWKRRLWSS